MQSCADFSAFNVQQYITRLEDLKDYNFPFTRIKQVEQNLADMAGPDEEEEKKEEPKVEEIKEEEETKEIKPKTMDE